MKWIRVFSDDTCWRLESGKTKGEVEQEESTDRVTMGD